MIDRKKLLSFLLLLTPMVALARTTQCPANAAAIPFHSLVGSPIVIQISINHVGPYEFMVDTGALVTIIDPRLATELNLRPRGLVRVTSILNYAAVDLVKPELVEAGTAAVEDLPVAVERLDQISALNPRVLGILGENFLGRFDMLIDNPHKLICLDHAKELENEMKGGRVPLLKQMDRGGELAYSQPILVTVHLEGDRGRGTVLEIDSGSNAPMLFVDRLDSPWWLQRKHALEGNVVSRRGALAFATMPSQDVEIGKDMTRPIAFLTPLGAGTKMRRAEVDGLLPTSLFNKVFISYADHFLMFDPR